MVKRKGKPQGIVVRSAPAPPVAISASSTATASKLAPVATLAANAATAANVDARSEGTTRQKKKKRRRTDHDTSAAEARTLEAVRDEASDVEANDVPPAVTSTSAISGAVAGGVVGPPPASTPLPALDFSRIGRRAGTEDILSWLLWPLSPAVFFSEYWEKKPLHLRRQRPDFYGDLFSKASLDKHLRASPGLDFGKHVNLVRFDAATGKKVALSPPAGAPDSPRLPAKAKEVDAAWAASATIQAMHPQQYHEAAWRLIAAMEGAFGSLFGSNAYLTPSGAQGLAPHYDDVEVLMLQLEGEKRWRLNAPPAGEEYPLPREYSRDFTTEELGEQLLDCVLQPGDLLYVPRGTVHHGIAVGEGFSHHLTLSTYQKMSWSQVMERIVMSAIEKAAGSNPDFREGLPVNFIRFMGTWHDTEDTDTEAASHRGAFAKRFKRLFRALEEFVDLDEACDELGVEHSAQRLPPAPPLPGAHSATPAAEQAGGASSSDAASAVTLDTRLRWVEPNAVRPVLSTDPETSEPTAVLFHSCGNERSLHMCRNTDVDEDVGCLRFEAALFMPALRTLYDAGPLAVRCGDLPLADPEDRTALCENLLEAGVLELVPGGIVSQELGKVK